MTDKELKKRLKKLAIGLMLVVILIIVLLIYTLGNKKAELSIYTSSGYVDHLQALGINESEFTEYLSIFGNLIDSNYNENQQKLNMATNFIENMSSYEGEVNESGLKSYEADRINEIVKEVQGTYIKNNIEESEIYEYHKEQNKYEQKQDLDRITYCMEIKEIAKNDDKIEVTYDLAIMNKEQMAEYMTGQNIELETHTVKAVIMNNTDYEYSKYFVSSIEEI